MGDIAANVVSEHVNGVSSCTTFNKLQKGDTFECFGFRPNGSPKRKYEWVPLIMKDVGVFETFCYYDVIQARLARNALLKVRVNTTIHSSSIHNALIAPIGTHTNVTNPSRKLTLQK